VTQHIKGVSAEMKPVGTLRSATQEGMTAENNSLRLLLEKAGIDAKALLAQAGIDAKEREAADKLQKLILEELHHRIKNTLATVSSIAAQSLRTATSIEHARQAIEGRLIALGRAHDLMLQASWANASLADTVRVAIKPFENQGAPRFSIVGPDIGITSSVVIALALTLNELGTNTMKFGALSVPDGRINIGWEVDEKDQRLKLNWSEAGGPVVNMPTRESFGTRMMLALGQQLNGQVQLSYLAAGFVYALDAPLSALTIKL
jgi:two-component sensor histidine kinase